VKQFAAFRFVILRFLLKKIFERFRTPEFVVEFETEKVSLTDAW
jgi:hypothetical protein